MASVILDWEGAKVMRVLDTPCRLQCVADAPSGLQCHAFALPGDVRCIDHAAALIPILPGLLLTATERDRYLSDSLSHRLSCPSCEGLSSALARIGGLPC